MTFRSLSLWHDTCDDAFVPRAALSGPTRVDVAIVGGGLTGLWAARSLAIADPTLSILVIESEVCGFGASGRNGGWCSALLPQGTDDPSMRAAMRDTINEVGRSLESDGIDAHFAHGGTLSLVTNPAHMERVRTHMEPGDTWLDGAALTDRIRAVGATAAAFTPHCAAVHPARLVRGLATAVERRGVRIVEGTRAHSIKPGRVVTDHGVVTARSILRCTEGYTPSLSGHRRTLVPIYSLMIATEPLADSAWDEIGLAQRETFTDGRNMIIYGQRTADGRFAFGGRGAPYHWGSSIDPRFDRDDRVFVDLERILRAMFPAIGSAQVTHRWGGPLGVPRDWIASVRYDSETGLGSAGGYVGDGVATTNLAGRTLADLVTGTSSALTTLSWVGHRSRSWEPEPFRYLGINAARWIATGADRSESQRQRPDRVRSKIMSMLTGG